jgi:hypothetical protein
MPQFVFNGDQTLVVPGIVIETPEGFETLTVNPGDVVDLPECPDVPGFEPVSGKAKDAIAAAPVPEPVEAPAVPEAAPAEPDPAAPAADS